MKTIKFLCTVSAEAIVAIATAVEKPKMEVIPLNAKQAIISITNENPAYFEVSIKALNGDMVYYKQSSKPITDYQKIFDFEKLKKGNYILNLKVNDTSLSKDFTMASNGILTGESKLRFDPYFDFENGILKLSYLNFDKENLKLNIYNNEGLSFQTKLGKDFSISKGYDLSKLEAGKYKVVLSSFNNEFVYSIEK